MKEKKLWESGTIELWKGGYKLYKCEEKKYKKMVEFAIEKIKRKLDRIFGSGFNLEQLINLYLLDNGWLCEALVKEFGTLPNLHIVEDSAYYLIAKEKGWVN